MKTVMFLWALVGCAVTGVGVWMVTTPTTVPLQPLPVVLVLFVFCIPPIGSFWMLFVVIRHEKHPLPWMLLAFLPYFSVGYYFERVRRNKVEARPDAKRTDP